MGKWRPFSRGTLGAAMVTAVYPAPTMSSQQIWNVWVWLEPAKDSIHRGDCVRFLCGGSHDHESICVQAHEFFNDNNGQLTESLLGK